MQIKYGSVRVYSEALGDMPLPQMQEYVRVAYAYQRLSILLRHHTYDIAGVLVSGGRFAWKLEAEEGAGRCLALAPAGCTRSQQCSFLQWTMVM